MSQPQSRKPKLSKILLGIDEVGRGPWAGPLVIGAVILGPQSGSWIDELTDSKKLTAKKREQLNQLILERAPAYGLGWVPATELDRYGLSRALKLAARRAVKQVLRAKVPFDEIIIDGTSNFLVNTPLADRVTILKKADLLVKEVSAASIIAKVARDNYMTQLAQTYPEYGFERHVGYGTAAHKQALLKYGTTPEHRQSFRPVASISTSTSTATGHKAELIVAKHLEGLGHQIIAHNFKTKAYEIDLISTTADCIYFTEVKYRKSSTHGTAIEQITPTKCEQMTFAAKSFLATHREYQQLQPLLAVAGVSQDSFKLDDWFTLT